MKHILIASCVGIFLLGCEEDIKAPANKVAFEAAVAGISPEEESLTINLNLSRETSAPVELTVDLSAIGLQYGTDFTTTPAAVNNVITLIIPAGESTASIVVTKVAGVGFAGDESLTFAISNVDGTPVIGSVNQIVVSFSEITVPSGSMNIQGGGSTAPNKVFIDLSANRQTIVERTTWDLGFSSGEDFRVILNSSTGMMAYVLAEKNDLSTVTANDTVGLGAKLSMAKVFAAANGNPDAEWLPGSINWIDNPAGDLTKTAIASVSATASENKVYIINRGDGPGGVKLGWKKIRVIRNGDGYTLQYADISASNFSELQIVKTATHAFQYVSIANGLVNVEPAKAKWDIAWTPFSGSSPLQDFIIPYFIQDVVLQNSNGVQTVQIMTSTKTYEAFSASDLAGLEFGTQNQLKIGTSWRIGGGPNSSPSLREDRFYVIKDAGGNYYKLKFTALTQDGERGRPAIQFALLQGGE